MLNHNTQEQSVNLVKETAAWSREDIYLKSIALTLDEIRKELALLPKVPQHNTGPR